jgi:phosphatidylserine/phosphatidylglycerophosphate/cardiolipin synthase-like enzyme
VQNEKDIQARNDRAAAYLGAAGITVQWDRKEQISHSKYVVADGERVLLGTMNWSVNDMQNNHQLNLEMEDGALATQLKRFHDERLAEAQPR